MEGQTLKDLSENARALKKGQNENKEALKNPQENAGTLKPNEHKCQECGKVFNGKGKLVRHQIVHGKVPKDFKCSHCDFETCYKHVLKIHILNMHNVTKLPEEFKGKQRTKSLYFQKQEMNNNKEMHSKINTKDIEPEVTMNLKQIAKSLSNRAKKEAQSSLNKPIAKAQSDENKNVSQSSSKKPNAKAKSMAVDDYFKNTRIRRMEEALKAESLARSQADILQQTPMKVIKQDPRENANNNSDFSIQKLISEKEEKFDNSNVIKKSRIGGGGKLVNLQYKPETVSPKKPSVEKLAEPNNKFLEVMKNLKKQLDKPQTEKKSIDESKSLKIEENPKTFENFSCEICDLKFVSKSYLEFHLSKHKEKVFSTINQPALPTAHTKELEVKVEESKNNQIKEKKIECRICGKNFKWSSNLVRHKRIFKHHYQEKTNVKSEPVGIKSEPKEIKSEPVHIKSEPIDIKSESRDIKYEPKEIKTEPKEIQHVPSRVKYKPGKTNIAHTIKSNKTDQSGKFKCKKCGNAYVQACNLTRHMRTHNPNAKTYDCEKCGKIFYRKDYLHRHDRSLSNSGLKLKCKSCKKQFLRSCEMKRCTHDK